VAAWIRSVGVDSVVCDGLDDHRRVEGAFLGQGMENGDHHVTDVHLEESPESLAGIAATEAVSTERVVRAGDPTCYLTGDQFLKVRYGHYWALTVSQ
tara:strand:- start:41 stop:331 length:291 start_codon:yes stop_codon:yes gene_type:complete